MGTSLQRVRFLGQGASRARTSGQQSGVPTAPLLTAGARGSVVACFQAAARQHPSERHRKVRLLPLSDRHALPLGAGVLMLCLRARAIHASKRHEWVFWFPKKPSVFTLRGWRVSGRPRTAQQDLI